MTKEKRVAKTEKKGDTKINFASFIPLQMAKFQKFWVPEYFLYQYTLLIKIEPTGSTIIFTSKFSFAA